MVLLEDTGTCHKISKAIGDMRSDTMRWNERGEILVVVPVVSN